MSRYAKAKAALKNYPDQSGDSSEARAVKGALEKQMQYYNGDARLRMVELVYFKKTHTLAGASVDTGYSMETINRWNTEILAAVDGRLEGPGA